MFRLLIIGTEIFYQIIYYICMYVLFNERDKYTHRYLYKLLIRLLTRDRYKKTIRSRWVVTLWPNEDWDSLVARLEIRITRLDFARDSFNLFRVEFIKGRNNKRKIRWPLSVCVCVFKQQEKNAFITTWFFAMQRIWKKLRALSVILNIYLIQRYFNEQLRDIKGRQLVSHERLNNDKKGYTRATTRKRHLFSTAWRPSIANNAKLKALGQWKTFQE